MSLFEKLFGAAENDINSALSGVKAEATKLSEALSARELQVATAQAQTNVPLPVAARPARPGDTDPKPYVGNTLAQLVKVRESYVAERNLVDKDIGKLTSEQTQLTASIDAVQSAIDKLDSPPKAPATDVAQWTQAQIDKATTDAIASDVVKS